MADETSTIGTETIPCPGDGRLVHAVALSVIVARALPTRATASNPHSDAFSWHVREASSRPRSSSAPPSSARPQTYHPHSDQALYDTLVRMARFSMLSAHRSTGASAQSTATRRAPALCRGPLPHRHGDAGGIDKDTVDWQPNYDERTQGRVLPGHFPNLLCNGTAGIAVATPPTCAAHLNEVVEAAIALLDDPDLEPKALLKHMHGPDFPTGGLILGRKGILDYFTTGKGSVTMQARAVPEPLPRGREAIIVTELPYQISKSALLEQIADLVNDGKLEGISDLRDESDRNGMRVVIELKRDAVADVVMNNLYKHTYMRTNFNANLLALVKVGGSLVPRQCTVKDATGAVSAAPARVVTRRTQCCSKQAEARLHC